MGVCLLGLVASSGCGGGLGKLHPVTGKVSGDYKEGDMVVFSKTGGTKGLDIQGTIKADGSFTMKTSSGKTTKDGVPEGNYQVSITSTPPSAGAGGDPGAMAGGAGGAVGGGNTGPPP